MVNLNKSSKPRGVKDFEKAKVKVGKLKKGAVNATDTSFIAKRLSMREQALSTAQKVQQAGASSSILAAHLTPHFAHIGHHNVHMRKDALGHVLRLCREAEKTQVEGVLGQVMEYVNKAMVDLEATVRTAAYGLLGWIFVHFAHNLFPFFGGWIQFLILAQSHISEEIRRDAGKFLDLAIKNVPQLLPPYLSQILLSLAQANINVKSNPRMKGAKPQELAQKLLDLIIAEDERGNSRQGILYVWQPKQTVSLRNVVLIRHLSRNKSTAEPLAEADIRLILRWMSMALADDWLEAAPLFSNPHHRANSLEKQAHGRVLVLLERLKKYILVMQHDVGLLYGLLPSAIRSNIM